MIITNLFVQHRILTYQQFQKKICAWIYLCILIKLKKNHEYCVIFISLFILPILLYFSTFFITTVFINVQIDIIDKLTYIAKLLDMCV